MSKPDPTSPAGMSAAELRVELAELHGISMATSKSMKADALRSAVIESRLTREDEVRRGRPNPYGKVQTEADIYEDDGATGSTEYTEVPGARIVRQAVLAKAEGKTVGQVEEELVDAGLDPDDDDFSDLDDLMDDEPEDTIEEIADAAEELLGALAGPLADIADPACMCGTEESAHRSVDPPHMFTPQGYEDDDLAAEFDSIREEEPLFIGMPGVLDYRFDGHAGAGPSGAKQWMSCTASLGASRKFLETLSPNQQRTFAEGGTAAKQGTTAHAIGEAEINLMLGLISPEEYDNTLLDLTLSPPDGETYDEEMAEGVAEYTDFAAALIGAGHEVLVEARVEAMIPLTVEGVYAHTYDDGDTLPDWYAVKGSADLVGLPTKAENTLTVVDLKYGKGIEVDAQANPQARLYALGVLSLLADDEGNLPLLDAINYVIVQPRLGGTKTWSESVDDLLTWRDEVLSPALTAALGLAPSEFAPSDEACEWCPVRGSCAALAEQRFAQGAELFDAVMDAESTGDTIEAGVLDNDRLASLLSQIEGLIGIKEDLKAEAQRRLHRGESLPGYQLVSHTPPRHWTEGVEETLAETPEVWKPSVLMTPTQALKLLGKERADLLDGLIVAPDKRPVIARVGDKRKTWTGIPPEQMFDDLEE